MATISSPRPSFGPSSRRTSTSTDTITTAGLQPATSTQRRNRAALRDFYNLNQPSPAPGATGGNASTSSAETLPLSDEPMNTMDGPDFDPDQYVADVLARESLEDVLRIEASLLRDMRGFDGERKALVYDNYSKLIGATETIHRMQGTMGPLKPTLATLGPAVAGIAEAAARLSSAPGVGEQIDKADVRAARQRVAVQYVLDTPGRLEAMLEQGRRDEAMHDWQHVSGTLDLWGSVPGTGELRTECEGLINADTD